MFSVLVWGCNWILFMHGWFYPIHLIHLIGRRSLHFEKNSLPYLQQSLESEQEHVITFFGAHGAYRKELVFTYFVRYGVFKHHVFQTPWWGVWIYLPFPPLVMVNRFQGEKITFIFNFSNNNLTPRCESLEIWEDFQTGYGNRCDIWDQSWLRGRCLNTMAFEFITSDLVGVKFVCNELSDNNEPSYFS